MEIIDILRERNTILFWFGAVNLAATVALIVLSFNKPIEFAGTNAWHKPIKFAISTAILAWSVGWYSGYLDQGKDMALVNWVIVLTLSFEVVYITWQASKGQASHYNQSSPFYALMFSLMALAASIATIAVGYVGVKFFASPIADLPTYYLWAIRFGFVLFFIFSFEGFVMGAKMAHTVGAADGAKGIPFFNWSISYGDLRIAHFIGMHALQILPLLAWYLLKSSALTMAVSAVYALLAVSVLIIALRGNSVLNLS